MKSFLQSLLFVITVLQILSGVSGRIGRNTLERKLGKAIPSNEQSIATRTIRAIEHKDQQEDRQLIECDLTTDGFSKPGFNCTGGDDKECEGFDCDEVWIAASAVIIVIAVLATICCIIMKVAVKIIVTGVVATIIIAIAMISAGAA